MAVKRSAEAVGLLRTGDVRLLLARYADLALAALVVSIVGMMIVPLPTPLLDLLISVNIAAAVTLLLVAIYVSDALKIATFPTLLLLTTLFRLALEVSATRLILLHADAGEVIRAFGNFVVAGNLVVGAVIFLILTMIQWKVDAEGRETDTTAQRRMSGKRCQDRRRSPASFPTIFFCRGALRHGDC